MSTVFDTTSYAVAVSIAGVAVDPSLVVADLTIRSGRTRADDGIEPASCTVELVETAPDAITLSMEDVLQITIDGAPRFTGRITEITRTPAGLAGSSWTLVATGDLARLSRFLLALPLPAETAQARAERVLSALGFSHTLLGGAGYQIAAYGVAGDAPAAADQILSSLVTDTGAIFQDNGDGSILVQFMDARLSEDRWTPAPELTSVELSFAQNDDVVNDLRVSWTGGIVSASSTGSIAQFDKRSVSLDTALNDAPSANQRAASIIGRLSFPAWGIDSLTTWDRDFFNHGIGAIVDVGPLPAGSPVESPWQGVMEGWVEHYQPSTDGSGRVLGSFLVSLGDLQHSAETVHWGGVTPTLHWAGVDPATSWQEAISNAALTP